MQTLPRCQIHPTEVITRPLHADHDTLSDAMAAHGVETAFDGCELIL